MSRLYTMTLAAITVDLLDTPATSIRGWIDDPNAHGVVLLGLTQWTCIPVGHARQRDVLFGAVWRNQAHGIGSLRHVYTLTSWDVGPQFDDALRVVHVDPRLSGLLATWLIGGVTTWFQDRLTTTEASDLILSAALAIE